jgi:hypothetical protein
MLGSCEGKSRALAVFCLEYQDIQASNLGLTKLHCRSGNFSEVKEGRKSTCSCVTPNHSTETCHLISHIFVSKRLSPGHSKDHASCLHVSLNRAPRADTGISLKNTATSPHVPRKSLIDRVEAGFDLPQVGSFCPFAIKPAFCKPRDGSQQIKAEAFFHLAPSVLENKSSCFLGLWWWNMLGL